MNKLALTALFGATVVTLSAGAAAADPRWSANDYGGRAYAAHGHDAERHDDGRYGDAMAINARQDRILRRIDRGLESGQITRREAWRLRAEARDIARLEHHYRMGGLSRWERADLDRRLDRLAAAVRFERHDREYGYGYGFRR